MQTISAAVVAIVFIVIIHITAILETGHALPIWAATIVGVVGVQFAWHLVRSK